jgi:large subunit ribosomal protein L23
MKLFGKKKAAPEPKAENPAPQQGKAVEVTARTQPEQAAATVAHTGTAKNLSAVLAAPHVTEKAAFANDRGVYVFAIARDATKRDVRAAVQAIFKVTPRRVNIVNTKPRTFVKRARNQRGTLPGGKKAYVFLKAGDRIDF